MYPVRSGGGGGGCPQGGAGAARLRRRGLPQGAALLLPYVAKHRFATSGGVVMVSAALSDGRRS